MPGPARILLFGGTFDPPHRAHVELPAIVADELGCQRIVYVPAARNPLKTDEQPTPDEHRLAMLELAIRDLPHAEISTIELERGGSSYFVETLEALRAQFGDEVDLRFLIGADQALAFKRWKDWQRILDLATPAVMQRPPYDTAAFAEQLADSFDEYEVQRWLSWMVETPMIDIRATEIRTRLARGEDVGDALDPAVASYIREHELYRR
jgi:nicotinate-nucleotide adenylyltransferase